MGPIRISKRAQYEDDRERLHDGKFAPKGEGEEHHAREREAHPRGGGEAPPEARSRGGNAPAKIEVHAPGAKATPEQRATTEATLRERKATVKGKQGASLVPGDLEKLKKAGGDGVRLPASYVPSEAVAFGGPDDAFAAKWFEVGKDGKLDTQYAYSLDQLRANAAEKWKRVERQEPEFDAFRAGLARSLAAAPPGAPHHAALAAAAVIAETGLRPGGSGSGRDDHYGVTTMELRHVTFAGREARIEYVGKEGVVNRAVVRDPDTLTALAHYAGVAAKAETNGPLLPTTPEAARAVTGEKVKDFRTVVATRQARALVAAHAPPPPPLDADPKKAAKQVAEVARGVAQKVCATLNNTWQMARDNYVHPEVWGALATRLGWEGPLFPEGKKKQAEATT